MGSNSHKPDKQINKEAEPPDNLLADLLRQCWSREKACFHRNIKDSGEQMLRVPGLVKVYGTDRFRDELSRDDQKRIDRTDGKAKPEDFRDPVHFIGLRIAKYERECIAKAKEEGKDPTTDPSIANLALVDDPILKWPADAYWVVKLYHVRNEQRERIDALLVAKSCKDDAQEKLETDSFCKVYRKFAAMGPVKFAACIWWDPKEMKIIYETFKEYIRSNMKSESDDDDAKLESKSKSEEEEEEDEGSSEEDSKPKRKKNDKRKDETSPAPKAKHDRNKPDQNKRGRTKREGKSKAASREQDQSSTKEKRRKKKKKQAKSRKRRKR